MNNNTTICAAATAPLILGISVNDIYMIGMLVLAALGLLMPLILAWVNKSKVEKDDVNKALDDAKDILEQLKNKEEGQ